MSLPGMFNPMLMAQGAAAAALAITGTATTTSTSAVTSHVVNLPSGIVAGEILFVAAPVGIAGGGWTVPSGWTAISGLSSTNAIMWKIASGSEGSTVTIVSDNGATTAVAYRIAGTNTATAPEFSFASGTSVNPNSPSLTPSWGSSTQTLYLSFESTSAVNATVSAFPTNYGLGQIQATANPAYHCGVSARILTSSPEDPAAYTITVSGPWGCYTIAFQGAS